MLTDLPRRLATSAISAALVVGALLFAHNPWVEYLVALAIASLSAIAVWEYAQFAKIRGAKIPTSLFVFCGFSQVLSFYLSARFVLLGLAPVLVYLLSILSFFVLHFRKNETGALVSLSLSSFGLSYVAVPMGMLLAILYMPQGGGTWWVAYLLLVTKATDIGGYFGGSLLGKKKLASHISPGKTVAGAWTGLLCALALSFSFYYFGKAFSPPGFSLSGVEWPLLGLLLGVLALFSDLAESLLKRDVNKKDSNRLPGLGGVLDTIDSLLFNIPLLYLYVYFLRPYFG